VKQLKIKHQKKIEQLRKRPAVRNWIAYGVNKQLHKRADKHTLDRNNVFKAKTIKRLNIHAKQQAEKRTEEVFDWKISVFRAKLIPKILGRAIEQWSNLTKVQQKLHNSAQQLQIYQNNTRAETAHLVIQHWRDRAGKSAKFWRCWDKTQLNSMKFCFHYWLERAIFNQSEAAFIHSRAKNMMFAALYIWRSELCYKQGLAALHNKVRQRNLRAAVQHWLLQSKIIKFEKFRQYKTLQTIQKNIKLLQQDNEIYIIIPNKSYERHCTQRAVNKLKHNIQRCRYLKLHYQTADRCYNYIALSNFFRGWRQLQQNKIQFYEEVMLYYSYKVIVQPIWLVLTAKVRQNRLNRGIKHRAISYQREIIANKRKIHHFRCKNQLKQLSMAVESWLDYCKQKSHIRRIRSKIQTNCNHNLVVHCMHNWSIRAAENRAHKLSAVRALLFNAALNNNVQYMQWKRKRTQLQAATNTWRYYTAVSNFNCTAEDRITSNHARYQQQFFFYRWINTAIKRHNHAALLEKMQAIINKASKTQAVTRWLNFVEQKSLRSSRHLSAQLFSQESVKRSHYLMWRKSLLMNQLLQETTHRAVIAVNSLKQRGAIQSLSHNAQQRKFEKSQLALAAEYAELNLRKQWLEQWKYSTFLKQSAWRIEQFQRKHAIINWHVAVQRSLHSRYQRVNLSKFYSMKLMKATLIQWIKRYQLRKQQESALQSIQSICDIYDLKKTMRIWHCFVQQQRQQSKYNEWKLLHQQRTMSAAWTIWRDEYQLTVEENQMNQTAKQLSQLNSRQLAIQTWRNFIHIKREFVIKPFLSAVSYSRHKLVVLSFLRWRVKFSEKLAENKLKRNSLAQWSNFALTRRENKQSAAAADSYLLLNSTSKYFYCWLRSFLSHTATENKLAQHLAKKSAGLRRAVISRWASFAENRKVQAQHSRMVRKFTNKTRNPLVLHKCVKLWKGFSQREQRQATGLKMLRWSAKKKAIEAWRNRITDKQRQRSQQLETCSHHNNNLVLDAFNNWLVGARNPLHYTDEGPKIRLFRRKINKRKQQLSVEAMELFVKAIRARRNAKIIAEKQLKTLRMRQAMRLWHGNSAASGIVQSKSKQIQALQQRSYLTLYFKAWLFLWHRKLSAINLATRIDSMMLRIFFTKFRNRTAAALELEEKLAQANAFYQYQALRSSVRFWNHCTKTIKNNTIRQLKQHHSANRFYQQHLSKFVLQLWVTSLRQAKSTKKLVQLADDHYCHAIFNYWNSRRMQRQKARHFWLRLIGGQRQLYQQQIQDQRAQQLEATLSAQLTATELSKSNQFYIYFVQKRFLVAWRAYSQRKLIQAINKLKRYEELKQTSHLKQIFLSTQSNQLKNKLQHKLTTQNKAANQRKKSILRRYFQLWRGAVTQQLLLDLASLHYKRKSALKAIKLLLIACYISKTDELGKNFAHARSRKRRLRQFFTAWMRVTSARVRVKPQAVLPSRRVTFAAQQQMIQV
jgi:hypothetical protein